MLIFSTSAFSGFFRLFIVGRFNRFAKCSFVPILTFVASDIITAADISVFSGNRHKTNNFDKNLDNSSVSKGLKSSQESKRLDIPKILFHWGGAVTLRRDFQVSVRFRFSQVLLSNFHALSITCCVTTSYCRWWHSLQSLPMTLNVIWVLLTLQKSLKRKPRKC